MGTRLSAAAQRFRSLHMVHLSCGQIAARARIEATLPFIEFAWHQRSTRSSKPLRIEVQGGAVRIID